MAAFHRIEPILTGLRTAILLQFEQGGLRNSYRCRHLLAAALDKLAPDKALAIDLDEFRCGHKSPPPFGVPAQGCAAPLPVGETGGSKGKGGGQGGSPGLHKRERGRPGIPWPARGQRPRSLPRARGGAP